MSNIGVSKKQPRHLQRYIILSNKYTTVLLLLALLFLSFNISHSNWERVIGNLVEILVILLVPFFNYHKNSLLGRFIFCITPIIATFGSRLNQETFTYLDYGIVSYTAFICVLAPLMLISARHEKLYFWVLIGLNFLFISFYNVFFSFISTSPIDFWSHPYTMLKIPEMALWFIIVLGVMIFKTVSENWEENLALKNEENKTARIEIAFLLEQVKEQNTLLGQKFSEIKINNETLKEKAQLRSQKLEHLNDKMFQYAHLNSHLLRSPIINIKGLIELLENENDKYEQQLIIKNLKSSIQKFDNAIVEINNVVEMNID